MIDLITSVLAFVFVFGILVFLHELGHYLAARYFDVKVEEFAFGLPPRLKAWKRGETDYAINAVPIGGYVRLLGEDGQVDDNPRNFQNKSRLARLVILFAGSFVHFLLAIGIFWIMIYQDGVAEPNGKVMIFDVNQESPAAEAGILPEDQVLRLDGLLVTEVDDFVSDINTLAGQEVLLSIYRESADQVLEIGLIPREDPPVGEGSLGVLIGEGADLYPVSILRAGQEGLRFSWEIVVYSFQAVGDLVQSLARAQVPDEISGPVGIASASGQAFQEGGLEGVFFLTGLLAANLAMFNLLPFPGLDGARILFILIETVRGKKLDVRKEAIIHGLGLALLVMLLVVVTYKDILKLFT